MRIWYVYEGGEKEEKMGEQCNRVGGMINNLGSRLLLVQ